MQMERGDVIVRAPFISNAQLEREASALLSEFARRRDVAIAAPIPIEDIIEKHLKLGLELGDVHDIVGAPRMQRNGAPDILGAIFFDTARIVIDESLDPDEHPDREARYRFTLAHEGAHWRLHKYLFAEVGMSQGRVEAGPSVVCRRSQAQARVERQADYFASCLLMPRTCVRAAWREVYSDGRPRWLSPSTAAPGSVVEINRIEARVGLFDCSETDDEALDRYARPVAERFLVSATAMRIRLEEMKLLVRPKPVLRRRADFA
jgi:hypothetical protein